MLDHARPLLDRGWSGGLATQLAALTIPTQAEHQNHSGPRPPELTQAQLDPEPRSWVVGSHLTGP